MTWNGWFYKTLLDKTRIWLGMARKAFYIPYPRFIHLDKTRIWLGKHVSQEFMISVRPLLIRPSVSAFYPNPTAISVISGTGMNLISNAASLMIFLPYFFRCLSLSTSNYLSLLEKCNVNGQFYQKENYNKF